MSNWQEAIDASTGKTYYYDLKTKGTSWSVPKGYVKKQTEWKAARDSGTGKMYFFHPKTGETRCDPESCAPAAA